ncbi:DUF5365 family protein [Peribacillus tepidiphilus]|uniref:DUF5365 family protein n=1 Tax=Peribacillus tepidiphilus TaxID=2652445 RepID=UPI0035B4FB08
MKIVYSSTYEQEEEISALISYIYSNVFTKYLKEKEIKQYKKMRVFDYPSLGTHYYGTLKEAYQIMTSLQVIISIIEKKNQFEDCDDVKLEELFVRNVKILEKYGMFFPLTFEHFSSITPLEGEKPFFMVPQPSNTMLI